MRQLFQNLKNGALSVRDVPVPVADDRFVLVQNQCSLISVGTEKSLVDLGKKSLVGKAMARPDLVRRVIDKARQEGVRRAYDVVSTRLAEEQPLGYSSAGIVEEAGPLARHVQPGMRVACAGAGYANHADYVSVPHNLVVPIPSNVSFDEAAFTTVGAIALQGVRLLDPKMGERFLVLGLGLLGQIAVQLLKANGCTVLGYDLDQAMVDRAAGFGAEPIAAAQNPVEACLAATQGRGVDGVLICAGTSSNDPITWAGEATRDKGRVVAVGAVGLDVPRDPYFRKEISLMVSRSYGPGRYDPAYEEGGQDYPVGYVRFTEQRNMETFLDLVAADKVDVKSLITHRFEFSKAHDAYGLLEGKQGEPYLGIVLEYGEGQAQAGSVRPQTAASHPPKIGADGRIGVYAIGAGNYASGTLLPLFKAVPEVSLVGVASGSGRGASNAARSLGIAEVGSPDDAFVRQDVSLVLILTRHDSHARYAQAALDSGRHAYVEKPLALDLASLSDLYKTSLARPAQHLTVGFNRRYAPLTRQVVDYLPASLGPKGINIRVNAGRLPDNSWINDERQGGGRIVGEVCHFIDLASAVAGAPVVSVSGRALGGTDEPPKLAQDAIVTVGLADGSMASILYTSRGPAQMSKEYVEVFAGGKGAVIDNFQTGQLIDGVRTQKIGSGRQDKGQSAIITAMLQGIRDGKTLQDPITLFSVSMATILAVEAIARGISLPVDLDLLGASEG